MAYVDDEEAGTGYADAGEEVTSLKREVSTTSKSENSITSVPARPHAADEDGVLTPMPVHRLQNYAFCPRQFYF